MKTINTFLLVTFFLLITNNILLPQSYINISPKNNSLYVSLSNNLILQSDKEIDPSSMSQDEILVQGTKSGVHNGIVKLSDDNKTILFIPDKQYTADEEVNISVNQGIKTIDGRNLPPVAIHFRTTKLTQRMIVNMSTLIGDDSQNKSSNYKPSHELKTKSASAYSLPSDFPKIIVDSSNNPAEGKLFLANFALTSSLAPNDSVPNYLMILDNDGSVVKYDKINELAVDFKIQPNGKLSYSDIEKSFGGYYEAGRILEMDTSFANIDTFQCGNGYVTFPADFLLMPNGHALAFAMDPQMVDLTQYGGNPDANAIGVVIQELDASKNVVFQWRTWDYIPVTDSYIDITAPTVDLIHANAIDLDQNGNIVFSMRHLSSVIKIDRQNGNIKWILGGKQNQFTFMNEHESNSPNYFSFQHDVKVLANGNITMFDNGNQHSPNYSRGVEYNLDEQNKTATMVWEYRHMPDIYGFAMGSVQRLSNGNTLIGWGLGSLAGAPAITEVHPDNTIALEVSLPIGQASFRAYKLPWASGVPQATSTLEVLQGNTYKFNSLNDTTGVTIKFDQLNSGLYAFTTVTSYNYSPLNPLFNDVPPLILPEYFDIKQLGVSSYTGEIQVNLYNYPSIKNPESTIVYSRPAAGSVFLPVATNYNPSTNELTFTTNSIGDFTFGIPQTIDSSYTPIPLSPKDSEIVNGLAPVKLLWGTKGIVQNYHLQVSNDPSFSSIVVDNSNITSTSYLLNQVTNNSTYYWRLSNTNSAGTSSWSNAESFNTASPFIKIYYPNGGEDVLLDSAYVIRWGSNLTDSLNIILMNGNNIALIIADSIFSGTNEFLWRIPSGLQQDSTYKIMISSISNSSLSSISSNYFYITSSITGIKGNNNIVKSYGLSQNYPNPFNPSTTIAYSIPLESQVRIEIYNTIGQRITTLVDGLKKAGNYEIVWNPVNASSGVYFYSINAYGNKGESFYTIRKMILLK